MNLDIVKVTQLGATYMVELNGTKIKGVKSYKVEVDSDGNAELHLKISANFRYMESTITLEQPTQNCRCNCT